MPAASRTDPTPLRPRLLGSLLGATTRELVWGRRAVTREVRRWQTAAEQIPDPSLRADALDALARKRGSIDGAALFWTLVRRRDLDLLRLMVAHELIWDYLDNVDERGAVAGVRDGRQLHLAVVESLDPDRPVSDYYRHHPWRHDGGFLTSLVHACRRWVRRLVSYDVVRPVLLREARRAAVQALNHEPDPAARDRSLRTWAGRQYGSTHASGTTWFELTAAASAPLAIFALLTVAARPHTTAADVEETFAAYFPWVSLAVVMLDSYADVDDDARSGSHSYLEHYDDDALALGRVHEIVERAMLGVRPLHNGLRHAVLVACMTAMYLSKDSVRAPERHATTRLIAEAGGSLTLLLLPVLRIWRIRYGQRSA
jgi:tetraprenyl-beta-curcumene synthase